MTNEIRLIKCRSCDERNCKGCNVYTLSQMLQRGDFDCLMDARHSIARTPESLRPKGRWVTVMDKPYLIYECSVCKVRWSYAAVLCMDYCPSCGADMREG